MEDEPEKQPSPDPNPSVPPPSRKPRGWHSRGFLPHLDSNDVTHHMTLHLIDSLPKETLARIISHLEEIDPERRRIEQRRRVEELLDAGHGACWLRRPECARIVQDSLLYFDGTRYTLFGWVVMPNHYHVLFQMINNWSMDDVIQSWKTFTTNAIGRIVKGPRELVLKIWHPDFFDRYIRSQRHFDNVLSYIHENPVKAGLVGKPEDWPWSSAFKGNLS